ncbi:S1 family peptidase [Streptomyces barkulensis]|uniref:S1 family peptidase n=1 Tax=Streptomyces barkulensis TaxID=1257026 RepID=UPI00118109E3|nr:S1 family peptidase [Streptomyces barkulensis]
MSGRFRTLAIAAAAGALVASTPAHAVPGDLGPGTAPPSPSGITQRAEADPSKQSARGNSDSAASQVADAIGRLGKTTKYSDEFSGIRVEPAGNKVILYATDPSEGRRMSGQGKAATAKVRNEAGEVVVEVRKSKYSRADMRAASAKIWEAEKKQRTGGSEIHSIVLRSDGSGLEVRTDDPARAAADRPRTAPVSADDIDYVKGQPVHNVSRENPSAPYPGGIPIRWDWYASGYTCTAAFGVRGSSGDEYLLTAEHCYDVGDGIEDMNGDNIGSVERENNITDSALISLNSQAGVWVNDDYVFDVRTTALSWDGEYVCQSGYTSYPNRCTIQVVNELVEWADDSGKTRQGVEARQCAGCNAVAHGDSGGPVWSTHSQGGLVARGIVSAATRRWKRVSPMSTCSSPR